MSPPEFNSGPDPVTHFNGFNTALVLGGAAPGYSSGQALDALEQVADEMLIPRGYAIDWSGISFQERKAGGQSIAGVCVCPAHGLPGACRLIRKLVDPLCRHPCVPFGILGALLAIWTRGLTNDIYFQIGLVTLIGLAAKNAILIVEFANQRYAAGEPLLDAALEAAHLRFRPIIMTSVAFILGVFPLVVATGAGAASRHSIGTGVFGGMLAATFLAIFFVPLFFVVIGKIARRGKGTAEAPSQSSLAAKDEFIFGRAEEKKSVFLYTGIKPVASFQQELLECLRHAGKPLVFPVHHMPMAHDGKILHIQDLEPFGLQLQLCGMQ